MRCQYWSLETAERERCDREATMVGRGESFAVCEADAASLEEEAGLHFEPRVCPCGQPATRISIIGGWRLRAGA